MNKLSSFSVKLIFSMPLALSALAPASFADDLKKWNWGDDQKPGEHQGTLEKDGHTYDFRTPDGSAYLQGEARRICDISKSGALANCRSPKPEEPAIPAASAPENCTMPSAEEVASRIKEITAMIAPMPPRQAATRAVTFPSTRLQLGLGSESVQLTNGAGQAVSGDAVQQVVSGEGRVGLGQDLAADLLADYQHSTLSLPNGDGTSRKQSLYGINLRAEGQALLDAFSSELHQKILVGAGVGLLSVSRLPASGSDIQNYAIVTPLLSLGLVKNFSDSTLDTVLTYGAAASSSYHLNSLDLALAYQSPLTQDLSLVSGLAYKKSDYHNIAEGTTTTRESFILSLGLAL